MTRTLGTTRRVLTHGLLMALAVLASACASTHGLQVESAGSVGCAPSDIEVTQVRGGPSGRSWTARCGGESFQCSAADDRCVRCAPFHRGGRVGGGNPTELTPEERERQEALLRRQGPRFEFSRHGDALRGVRATFRTEDASMMFTFAPERDRDTVNVAVVAGEGQTLTACEDLALAHDGETVLTAPLTDQAATVPRRQLTRFARGEHAPTVRFCGQAWELRRADVYGFERFAEHMDEALANVPAESAPPVEFTPPVDPVPAAVSGTDQAVRAQLDERAVSLRGCAGVSATEVLPIEATWDAAGAITLRVRGQSDQAVHECATSVLGPWRAPAGAAGRLIHVLGPR